MSKYIKDLKSEEVSKLSEQIEFISGQVQFNTLVENDYVRLALAALDKGTQIDTHHTAGDAFVQVIEGTGKYIVENSEYIVKQGEFLIIPANKHHSVHGIERLKMLLTVIFPT